MKKTYSKTRRNFAIGFAALLGVGIIAAPIICKAESETEISNLYPETGIVTSVEELPEDKFLLTITVANGNIFQCETDVCDWFVNDLASMLMDSKGTENTVYDDEIILCYYSGVIEHFENHLVDED